MIHRRLGKLLPAILIALVALLSAEPVLACSVCYGDPSAPTSQGVQAGVLVLLGVVLTVLALFAALLISWIRRAAQMAAQAEAIEEAGRI